MGTAAMPDWYAAVLLNTKVRPAWPKKAGNSSPTRCKNIHPGAFLALSISGQTGGKITGNVD